MGLQIVPIKNNTVFKHDPCSPKKLKIYREIISQNNPTFVIRFIDLDKGKIAQIMKDYHVVYEDNHLLIVNKRAGILVQGDSTGDRTLTDVLKDYRS